MIIQSTSWSSGNVLVPVAGGLKFKSRAVTFDTILAMAHHCCDISSKQAVLLGRNDVEMRAPQTRCTLRRNTAKIKDLIISYKQYPESYRYNQNL